MADRDPRMLHGTSARTLWTTFATFLLGGIVVPVLAEPFLLIDSGAGAYNTTIGVGVLSAVGGALIVAIAGATATYPRAIARQRAELRAGYTTLVREFDHVDGIDSKSGQIVRPAIRQPTGSNPGAAITTGMELGEVIIPSGHLRTTLRVRSAVIGFLASLAVFVLASLWLIDLNSGPAVNSWLGVAAFIVGVAGLCGVITIPVVTYQFAPVHYNLALLGARTPDTTAFRAQLSDGDVVTELLGVDAPALPEARYIASCLIAFEPEQVVMYRQTTRALIPFLVVPRSRIASAQMKWDATAGTGHFAAVLSIAKDNGSHLDEMLTLTPKTTWGGWKQIQRQNEWIVDWASRRPFH